MLGFEAKPGASILEGLTFSLSGFMAGTEWPQILNGDVWLPLVILFLFRAVRGKRPVFRATASGALVGVWALALAGFILVGLT